MNPLLVVVPYCTKDVAQAKQLVEWINEVGAGNREAAILFVADSMVPRDTMVEINELSKKTFDEAHTISVRVPTEKQAWPHGANVMFSEAAKQVYECYKWSWLWLEPDAVPLKKGWLDAIREGAHYAARRYFGTITRSDQPPLPKAHMAGVSVYPQNAYMELKGYCASNLAFDMAMAHHVVPRCTETNLIQEHWGEEGKPPVFMNRTSMTAPEAVESIQNNMVGLDFIRPEAVLFHRCKDGSLIELLRQQINSGGIGIGSTRDRVPPGNAQEKLDAFTIEPPPTPKKGRGWPKGKPRKPVLVPA